MEPDPREVRARALERLRRRRNRERAVTALALVAVGIGLLLWSRPDSEEPFDPQGGNHADARNRFTIDVPDGWGVSAVNLEPQLGDARHRWEIFAAGTYPLGAGAGGTSCAQYPMNAILDLPEDGALVVIQEPRDGRSLGTRPRRFGPASSGPNDFSAQCLPRFLQREAHMYDFIDARRGFYAYVWFGPRTTDARKQEAWSMLDSFNPAPRR